MGCWKKPTIHSSQTVYFTSYGDTQKSFRDLCIEGKLELAKLLFYSRKDYIFDVQSVFRECCIYGHLPMVKWLSTLDKIDYRWYDNFLFKSSCGLGNLGMSKWLYNRTNLQSPISSQDMNEAFIRSCSGGHLLVTTWLYTFDIEYEVDKAFVRACMNGRSWIASWLYNSNKIDHDCIKKAFEASVIAGHGDISNWLAKFLLVRKVISEKYCSICLKEDKTVVLTKCGHVFGYKCLASWQRERNICPLCRAALAVVAYDEDPLEKSIDEEDHQSFMWYMVPP